MRHLTECTELLLEFAKNNGGDEGLIEDTERLLDVIPEWPLRSWLGVLRTNARLSLSKVAASTGLSGGYINNLENGRGTPSMGTVIKLARAYNVTSLDVLVPLLGKEKDDNE